MAKKTGKRTEVVTLTEKQQIKRRQKVIAAVAKIERQLAKLERMGLNERQIQAIDAALRRLKF